MTRLLLPLIAGAGLVLAAAFSIAIVTGAV